MQLVGSDEPRDLDLNVLQDGGVQVVGRLQAISGGTAQCSGSLGNLVTNADLKQARLLRRIDEFVSDHGLAAEVEPACDARPTSVTRPPTELDLTGYSTVVWATGYRPTYPWLPPEAFDRRGRVAHDGGVGALPGLYLLGLPFMRRRRSNLIVGLACDAAELGRHLRTSLDRQSRARLTGSRS